VARGFCNNYRLENDMTAGRMVGLYISLDLYRRRLHMCSGQNAPVPSEQRGQVHRESKNWATFIFSVTLVIVDRWIGFVDKLRNTVK